MSEQDKSPPTPTPDALPRTHADGYQPGSDEPAGSPGYQSASEEPPSSTEVPESLSAEEDDEGLDPYEAFAEASTTPRERKKREREPGTWMPGSDEFDHELGREDAETRFSRDSWGGRALHRSASGSGRGTSSGFAERPISTESAPPRSPA